MAEVPWERVRGVFEASLDRPEGERARWAEEACAGDAALWAQVRRLLRTRPPVEDFLESPTTAADAAPPPGEAAPLAAGLRLGGFTLVRPLASGGMGEVWIAEQEEPRRTVAVKTLRGGFASGHARRRFRYEAEVLARLQHPGIAPILAAGTLDAAGERPWFAMEYVEEGRALTAHADGEGLGREARLRLFLEVCEAVQHGHGRGVIHRDLKPDNLLVDRRGRVRVIDFGIARAAERDEGSTALTEAGQVLGTLRCMAPEQLGGDPDAVDIRADVYALGAVLYELLCGRSPHPIEGQPLPFTVLNGTPGYINLLDAMNSFQLCCELRAACRLWSPG